MFQGFSEDTIQFFLDLRFNNFQSFFASNKPRFERVKAEFSNLIEDVAQQITDIDPSFETRPSKALARIRRDTRFSKDKTPYRDHLWFIFKKANVERDGNPFLWFELTIEKAVFGVGVWGNAKPFYDMARQEMLKSPKKIQGILHELLAQGFTAEGERYKRLKLPNALPDDCVALFQSKSFYLSKLIEPIELIFSKDLVDVLVEQYHLLAPYYQWAQYIANKVQMENQ